MQPPATALRRIGCAALLLCLIGVHAGVNALWLRRDRTMRAFDQVPQTAAQLYALNLLRLRGVRALPAILRGTEAGHWPSASYLPLAGPALLFGQRLAQLRLYNVVYLAILLGAVFAIGRRLHSPRAGLLAAALLSLYPLVYGASRQLGADLPGAAMVALSIAALLATERWSRLGPALACGACVGVALLVRPHALFHLAAPIAWGLGVALARPVAGARWTALRNALLAAGAAAAVSWVWWAGRLHELGQIFWLHQSGTQMQPAWTTGSSLLFYLRALPDAASALLLGVAALAVTWRLARRRPAAEAGPHADAHAVIIAWGCGALLVLACIKVHFLRFLLPALPPLALATAAGALSIVRRTPRCAATALLCGLAVASWLGCSFGAWRDHSCRWQCGAWEYSGPPARDELYVAAEEIADLLRRHGDGFHMLVHLPSPEPTDPHPPVLVAGVLWSELPRLLFTERSFAGYANRPDLEVGTFLDRHIGGHTLPRPTAPVRHCYWIDLWREPIHHDRTTAPLYRRSIDHARLTVTLHRSEICPPAAGRESR